MRTVKFHVFKSIQLPCVAFLGDFDFPVGGAK